MPPWLPRHRWACPTSPEISVRLAETAVRHPPQSLYGFNRFGCTTSRRNDCSFSTVLHTPSSTNGFLATEVLEQPAPTTPGDDPPSCLPMPGAQVANIPRRQTRGSLLVRRSPDARLSGQAGRVPMLRGETASVVAAPIAFGALLRQHRLAARLTQQHLAGRAGLSVHGIQKLEHGSTHPYPNTVERLVQALGLSPQEQLRFAAAARAVSRRQRRS